MQSDPGIPATVTAIIYPVFNTSCIQALGYMKCNLFIP